MPMDNEYFQDWLAGIDNLSAAQRAEAEAVLMGRCKAVSSLAAVELAVGDDSRWVTIGISFELLLSRRIIT